MSYDERCGGIVPSPDQLHSSSVHDEEASIYSTIRAGKDQHSGDHKVVSSITACLPERS